MAQWALVTGATAGIGESFTRLLASKGYNLALVARDEARLHERAAGLREKYGVQTFVLPADLSTNEGCASVEDYIKTYEIDVLINNAGFGINKAFSASELVAEQQMFDVLIRTPMRLMHTAIPGMKQRNSGTIINVSSVAAWITGGHYSAMKSYLMVLSESLHTELAETAVKVCSLAPGFTHTEFHQRGKMKMDALPNFMWLNADNVVITAWEDAKAGKAISIPGRQYRFLYLLLRFAPRDFVRKGGFSFRRRQR